MYLDACHLDDGFHPGPVTTLDGLVAALSEQGGMGRRDRPIGHLRRRLPRQDVPTHRPRRALGLHQRHGWAHERFQSADGGALRSWLNEDDSNLGGSYYEPGQLETLMVLDIDGTVVVINANLWPGSSAADRAEFAAVLDSIRIDRG